MVTPTDLVIQYRQQGYDDATIQQGLVQQGYSNQEVLDAFNQAGNKQTETQPAQNMDANDEEIIESIVEEKWKELQKKLSEFSDWKDKIDSRLTTVEQQVSMLKENFDKLHEGVLGKIGEYDTNLQDVGTSIKAMDQVFKKVLPSLTESVNKLEKISGSKSSPSPTSRQKQSL